MLRAGADDYRQYGGKAVQPYDRQYHEAIKRRGCSGGSAGGVYAREEMHNGFLTGAERGDIMRIEHIAMYVNDLERPAHNGGRIL